VGSSVDCFTEFNLWPLGGIDVQFRLSTSPGRAIATQTATITGKINIRGSAALALRLQAGPAGCRKYYPVVV